VHAPVNQASGDSERATYETPRDDSYKAAQAWQVESENLHSSVASPQQQHVTSSAAGNHGDRCMLELNLKAEKSPRLRGTRLEPGPDLLNGTDRVPDSRLSSPNCFRTNDNRDFVPPAAPQMISRNIYSIESVSSSSKSGSASRSSTGKSSCSKRSFSARHEPLPPPPPPPQEAAAGTPPPLPPKSLRVSSPKQRPHIPEFVQSAVDPQPVSSTNVTNRTLKELANDRPHHSWSGSEVSIPGIGGGVKRTPSQYAAMERKMIKAGFYAVPTKPPLHPSVQEDQASDDEVDRALDELDIATQSLHCSDSDDETVGNSALNDSDSGKYGVVVESDDSDKSVKKLSVDRSLLAPIEMNFSDHCPDGTDCSYPDALSSFATEMEASFDRIRQTLSTDRLNNYRFTTAPLTSSLDVLSMTDAQPLPGVSQVTTSSSLTDASRIGLNANNNNSCDADSLQSRVWVNRHAMQL